MARGDLIDQGVIIGVYRGRRSRIWHSRIPRVLFAKKSARSVEPLLPESRSRVSYESVTSRIFIYVPCNAISPYCKI